MLFVLAPLSPTLISLWGGIRRFLIRFLFGVHGICRFLTKILFGVGSRVIYRFFSSIESFIFCCIYNFSFEKNPSIFCLISFLFNNFSPLQVFEQSLFLFVPKTVGKKGENEDRKTVKTSHMDTYGWSWSYLLF